MTPPREGGDFNALVTTLKVFGEQEGGSTFMGWPDRWWDVFLRRCENGHVSTMTLKSEELGRDACLACRGRVTMTFPEDQDGPLVLRYEQ